MFQKIPLKIEIPFTPSSRKSPIKSSTQIYDHNSFTFAISSPKFGFNPNFFHSSTVKKTDDITELYSNDLNNPESIASEKSSPNNKLKYLKKRLNLNDLTQEHLLELAIMILQKGRGFRNNMDIRMLERTTKNVEFFQKYDKDTIEQICKHMMYQSAEKNETLFDIGSLGDTFYIILKGSVEVWINIPKTIEEIKPDGSVESRTERILTNVRTLQAGNSFGELSLLENQPRAATIVCREKCFFGVLDKTSFDNILSNFGYFFMIFNDMV